MRSIAPSLCLAALLCAAPASCDKGPAEGGGLPEIYEQEFSLGTRAGLDGSPQHGDAYTLMSYNVGGTSSIPTFKSQISEARSCGYYAYDDGQVSGRPAGMLVPVATKTPATSDVPPFTPDQFYLPTYGAAPLTMDRSQAQKLASSPAAGLNPATNVGLYRTAVIHPAVPAILATNLGYLAVFHIATDIWASDPDDADGDPDTDDPFEILVNANGTVHALPERTELFPVKSAISVSFYSEYFADNDPGMTSPHTQTFEITSLKLVNVGSNGWYNARTGIVYPNYNYGNLPVSGNYAGSNWRTVYSSAEMGVNPDGSPIYPARGAYNYSNLLDPDHNGDEDDSLLVDESGNDRLPPQRPGFPAPTKYIQWSVETPVFPSDYRGAENGGLTEVKPLSLRLELSVGSATLKAAVPIAIVMERGKKYNFYVNVMSEMISISYNVSPWGNGGGSDDVGGDMIDYLDIDIEYTPGGWIVVGGGTEDIGS